MSKIVLNDGREIGNGLKPYYVAEVNSSHNGNVDVAKEMIQKAKEAGCDCVKFQSWSADSLYSKTYYDSNPIAKRIIGKFSLDFDAQRELALYCKEQQISFASTPYSIEEVDFLLGDCNVPYIKIASMDINNYNFLQYIAKNDTAIVLATGMANEEEIKNAVHVIKEAGNERLCILHCVSVYPAEAYMMQLRNIIGFQKMFPNIPVGFSDHTMGIEIACASIALGSCMVEKHFTLDNNKMGMDNNMATEPEIFAQMISGCNNVFSAMGEEQRSVIPEEEEQRKKMRRSVVARKNLKKGSIIQAEELDVKRPGDGISVDKIVNVIGKRLLRDIEQDTLIYEEDLEDAGQDKSIMRS